MASTTTLLAWGYLSYKEAYKQAGNTSKLAIVSVLKYP